MSLKWFDTVAELKALGADQPGLNVFPLYSGPFPLVHDAMADDGSGTVVPGPRQKVELVNAKIFKVTVGSDEYNSLTLCRIGDDGKPQWTIYCGDKQVEGAFRNDGKTLANELRKEGKVSNGIANLCESSDWVNKVPDAARCGFFSMQKRTGRICSHTQAVLANLPTSELDEMATQLQDWKSGAAVAASVTTGPLSPEEATFFDAAFIQHVLLAGERGAGKTYLGRAAADRYDAEYIEMQMHPSMESWEFFSHDRAQGGKVFTVQGPFARVADAILNRKKKVVLVMDEFLNMNPVYATVVNSPLSLTADDTYRLHTGNLIIDEVRGTAIPEEVEVPADMLWVVATSNIGARYGLDKIAPSVRARFQIVLMNTNPDRTKTILEKNLSKYDMPMEFAEMFKKFIEACNQAVQENTLDEEATTRLACNVVRAVALKAKRDGKKYTNLKSWLPVIKAQVLVEIAQVVNFELGPLDPDQEARFKAIVDTSFKASR